MKPKEIIIHHSLTDDCDKLSWGSIRNYHKALGWRDIGYHFGIEKVRGGYEVLKGRPLTTNGAHTKGKNKDTIGICCVGNFDKTKPPKDMINKLVILIKELMEIYHIKKSNIKAHKDYTDYKSCPGDKFDMDELRGLL
jgi:hypothetical protein